jgi:chromosome segregation ATPase
MQMNKLMKLSKKLAVVATVAMTMVMPLTAYAAPANFNAAYYAAKNPDVVKVYGSSYEALAKHYDTFGMLEGRNAYEGDTKAAFIRLANAHYAAGTGLAKVFDAKWYAAQNPDAVKAFGNDPFKLFEHFIIYGLSEGRVPSENFNAQEFFKENAALAVVVSQAFADVPTTSANSFVQVAQQVSNTLNVVNANPVVNVTTETTNNTVNNTVNNSSDKEETPAQTSQSVNKLEAVKQMTAQATKSKNILTASASSMSSKASEAKTKMAAIQTEIAALNGEMTQEQRNEFIDRITEVIGLAYSAQEEAIVLNNQVQVVTKNTEASIRYAAEYLNELTTTKTNLTNKKDSLEAQKAVAEESFAAGVTNFEGTSAALTTAQRALNNANSAYANAVALVETLTNQKAEQIEIVAQAQTAAQEAEQAVLNAAAIIAQTTEVQTLLTERQVFQNEYDSMTEEQKASPAGVIILKEIEQRTAQADQIGNDLTTDLRNDLVDKGNAYNREATKLTGITNQLAAAEEAVTTTSANAAAAAENLEQAKTDYLADLDTQITNTTNAITEVQETIDEVNACGQEMYNDVQEINSDEVYGATVDIIYGDGTEANPGSSSETFQAAEEAKEEVNNATIVTSTTPDEDSSEENTSENNSSNQD